MFDTKIEAAAAFLRERFGEIPAIALVLGSGLGILVDDIEDAIDVPTQEIPHYPESTVEGHAGHLVKGLLNGVPVLAFKGRVHGYEGYTQSEVVFPVRLVAALGVSTLVTTNAVGSINRHMEPGDLMLIEDHINMMFRNPLIGSNNEEMGPRFPDMSAAYSPRLQALAKQAALDVKVDLKVGVMGGVTGPSYETPAEIRMLGILGADVVGMSTIPEAIAAAHLSLEMASISCITNHAAGIAKQPLNHAEVTEVAQQARGRFTQLLCEFLCRI
jgi:purine-nucleoside phosphorylase